MGLRAESLCCPCGTSPLHGWLAVLVVVIDAAAHAAFLGVLSSESPEYLRLANYEFHYSALDLCVVRRLTLDMGLELSCTADRHSHSIITSSPENDG